MKVALLTTLALFVSSVLAAPPIEHVSDISVRDGSPLEQYSPLEKRKGGGGGKGGGSGGSRSGGGGGSS
ncbi:MAG: hypothetical protein M1823_008385, partial [Watsoniomyces obsoletus]